MSSSQAHHHHRGSTDDADALQHSQSPSPAREMAIASSPSTASESYMGFPSATTQVSDLVFPIRSVVSVEKSTSKSNADDDSSSTPLSIDTTTTPVPLSRESNLNTRSASSPRSSAAAVMSPRTHARGRSRSSVELNPRVLPITPFELDTQAWEHESQEEEEEEEKEKEEKEEKEADLPLSDRQLSTERSSQISENQSYPDLPLINARFTHVETPEGHAIITGRAGVLQHCQDEPIHTPGAVQGFGCLLALIEETDGNFVVHYVSENSKSLIGYSPRSLFRLSNFLDILTDDQQDNLLDHIDFIRDEESDPALNGPEIFSLSVRHPKLGRSVKLWCAIHINAAHPDLVICEFELDDDRIHPLRPPQENNHHPTAPTHTLDSNPSEQALHESTQVISKPLRIIRSARKRRGEQGAMQVFDILSQVQEQLASATNLHHFLKILVGIVKELTGFHRIMIYQFDASCNGKVITELVDTSFTLDLYKGLHFPASDIPRQARDLYKINKVRLIYDRDQPTARIVCRSPKDLDTPLDMTHAYLRAMSPIHVKYLGNMQVRSSMSISINAFNELWGLIACHSYGEHGMRVSFPVRKLCRLVGETASRNIERLTYASRLQARKLINTSPTDKNPSGYIVASSDDLLTLFNADCGLLSIKDETKVLGVMEHSKEALALLEYLRMRRFTSVVASQDVKADFPDLKYSPGFHFIAGLLYVPLSVRGNYFIVFFRQGQVTEVKWAGNPYQKNIQKGTTAYLEPRASFKAWNETVMGKCRPWDQEQVETASVLCLVYGKFIEIWRQKEAALENSKLTRLLLANSAHEVRTPLNAIINYLEIALEGSLDGETRDNLVRSHSASKSLIYVINDLLDLTKAEKGQNLLIKDEVFDLGICIQEATSPFKIDADRKGLDYVVARHDGLPKLIHGDNRRVRQALSNITANAIKHTDQGSININIHVVEIEEKIATIEFEVTDTGTGMSSQQLDALFRDLEQVSASGPDPQDSPTSPQDTKSPQTLGLGLAVVGRIVRNMNGQLRLTSEVGKGSRFIMQLPFQLPKDEVPDAPEATSNVRRSSQGHLKRPDGEITLVHKTAAPDCASVKGTSIGSGGRRSGSQGSRGSCESGKNDADGLIDAIQTTPLSRPDEDVAYFPSRKNTRLVANRSSTLSLADRAASESDSKTTLLPPLTHAEPDTLPIADSKTTTPIKTAKLADKRSSTTLMSSPVRSTQKLVKIQSQLAGPKKQSRASQEMPLRVLIAEDDPINLKILRKRLERLGHTVTHAVNGEDCAALFGTTGGEVDIILMDMQMPIVDGLTSTQMIRCMEKDEAETRRIQSVMSQRNGGRVPIIAVSASLDEEKRGSYIDAGFDAWILKPIDFKRLSILMSGIHDDEARDATVYAHGQWEAGGWFFKRDIMKG